METNILDRMLKVLIMRCGYSTSDVIHIWCNPQNKFYSKYSVLYDRLRKHNIIEWGYGKVANDFQSKASTYFKKR